MQINNNYDSFWWCIFQNFRNNFKTFCQPKILQINTNNTLCLGHFPFNKYSSLKFRKFYLPNETDTPVWQTRPKLPHIWLLYGHFVTRIQKNRSEDNKFVKWKGTFQSDQQDQSYGTSLIFWPGQTRMVQSIILISSETSGILGWMESIGTPSLKIS